MPPKKKPEAIAVQQPTRRSTRTRRPTSRVLEAAQDDTVVHRPKETIVAAAPASAAHDEPTVSDEANTSEKKENEPEEHQLATTATTATIESTTIIATTTVVESEKEDQAVEQDHGGRESSAEDIIVARPGPANATTPRTPLPMASKAKVPYVAGPASEDKDRDEDEDELITERPAVKIIKITDSSRKGRSKYDNPEEMLTNPRSPLASAKLRDILCSPQAWDLLNAEEKMRVLAKFPGNHDNPSSTVEEGVNAATGPNIASLRSNDDFRHDVARYQDNLAKGKHDPEWIRQAQDAHQHRVLGFYNEYIAARFEEDWGMQMPRIGDGDGDDEGGASSGINGTEIDKASGGDQNGNGAMDMEDGVDGDVIMSIGDAPDSEEGVAVGKG